MATEKAPRTPPNVKDPQYLQLPTPSATSYKPSKIVTLRTNRLRLPLEYCHKQSKLSQMVTYPSAPMEATAVAIHPFYRGEKLDGSYYEWLNEYVYDGNMPDIIRRINKFREFPQNDDPAFNPESSNYYKALHASKDAKEELQRYMPYLEAYWNECNDSYETHTDMLGLHYERSGSSDGREEIPYNTSLPEIVVGPADSKYMIAGRASKDSHASCGLYIFHDNHRSMAQSPGLLWCNLRCVNNDSSILALSPYIKVNANLAASIPSALQYHHPSGEIITSKSEHVPDYPVYSELKARTNIQVLARANGFLPSPRSGIGAFAGWAYCWGHHNEVTLHNKIFPMGALRYQPEPDQCMTTIPYSSNLELKTLNNTNGFSTAGKDFKKLSLLNSMDSWTSSQTYKTKDKFLDGSTVDDQSATAHPGPGNNAGNRKRATRQAITSPRLATKRKRRASNNWRKSRKGKRKGEDEDYAYEGDNLNDEERMLEKRAYRAKPRKSRPITKAPARVAS